MKRICLISLSILIYHVYLFYIGWNGYVLFQTAFTHFQLAAYIIIVLILAYSYFLSHAFPSIAIYKILGSYWLAVLQYALFLLPAANILYFILSFYLERTTNILITGTIAVITFLLIFLFGTYNAYSPVIKKYKLTLPKKSSHRRSLTIAMASDMHFGTLSGNAHLNKLVSKINELQADLILLPGDIIDDDPNPFLQKKMGDKMKNLKAPLGIFGVLGNHEYYGKKIPEFLQEMDRIGINILLDEKVLIDNSFVLIGRKDKTDKQRQTIQQLVEAKKEDLPLIMMDHQPAELTEAMNEGIDLIVSGHTHRGQMAPNHFITRRVFELDWGYLKKNQLHAIVSSGFGFWGPPIRLGSRSEIVYIDIQLI
ncbi:metallophosphoesterase [Niallia sp. 03133]|uniref:metallophosphoesterase n=1 Tax=Niallia sp. 03133 TaxID=3458060 RepID=UPI004044C766